MTEAARELLTVFDGLPRADQEEVTAEILRRAPRPMACRRMPCTS